MQEFVHQYMLTSGMNIKYKSTHLWLKESIDCRITKPMESYLKNCLGWLLDDGVY